ncbi:5TMR of 5TMR-LYT [anaerobic digester metagenome]|nr:SpoIIE family protein phosphatase [Methanobacterium sp. YSL]
MSKITFKDRIYTIRDYLAGDEEVPIMYIHAIMAIIGSVSVLLILQFHEMPMSSVQHSLLVLVEKACVIVVIAYVVSRLSMFTEILEGKFTIKNQAVLILIFGAISIFGTHSGVDVFGAMANVRDLGPMVAGLIGGPLVGLGAGLIGGLYRLSLGGFTAVPCAFSTILAGLLAGLVFLINKRRFVGIFWAVVFAVLMESLHLLINLAVAQPYSQALAVVEELTIPIIVSNALGMFIFAFIISNLLRERETIKQRDLYFDELERKKHELNVASKIQKSFLPEELPPIPGFQVAALNIPAHEVGGDFYDFITISPEKTGIVIADVTGDSFPASLLMALSRTIIRGEAKNLNPQKLLRYLNHMIAVDIGPEIFLTILYGELNLKSKCFTYVNAAHIPPLIYRNGTNQLEELVRGEKSLGRLENIELEKYKVKIENGDIIIFYTDGVVKSLEDKEISGDEVLRRMISSNHELSPQALVDKLKNRAAKSESNLDDMALAILKANYYFDE